MPVTLGTTPSGVVPRSWIVYVGASAATWTAPDGPMAPNASTSPARGAMRLMTLTSLSPRGRRATGVPPAEVGQTHGSSGAYEPRHTCAAVPEITKRKKLLPFRTLG